MRGAQCISGAGSDGSRRPAPHRLSFRPPRVDGVTPGGVLVFAADIRREVQGCAAGVPDLPGRAKGHFGGEPRSRQVEAGLRDFELRERAARLRGRGERLSARLPDPRLAAPRGVSCALKAVRERRRLGNEYRSTARGEEVSPSSAATRGPPVRCTTRVGEGGRVDACGQQPLLWEHGSPAAAACGSHLASAGEAFPDSGASKACAEFVSRGKSGEQRCSRKLLWLGSDRSDSTHRRAAFRRAAAKPRLASRAVRPGGIHRGAPAQPCSGCAKPLPVHAVNRRGAPGPEATGRRAPLCGFSERVVLAQRCEPGRWRLRITT